MRVQWAGPVHCSPSGWVGDHPFQIPPTGWAGGHGRGTAPLTTCRTCDTWNMQLPDLGPRVARLQSQRQRLVRIIRTRAGRCRESGRQQWEPVYTRAQPGQRRRQSWAYSEGTGQPALGCSCWDTEPCPQTLEGRGVQVGRTQHLPPGALLQTGGQDSAPRWLSPGRPPACVLTGGAVWALVTGHCATREAHARAGARREKRGEGRRRHKHMMWSQPGGDGTCLGPWLYR